LKTFLTQIGPVLPLTSDPPVTCFWKWIGWKDYDVPKNRNLESVPDKNEILFSPHPRIPTLLYPQRAPTSFPLGGDRPTLLRSNDSPTRAMYLFDPNLSFLSPHTPAILPRRCAHTGEPPPQFNSPAKAASPAPRTLGAMRSGISGWTWESRAPRPRRPLPPPLQHVCRSTWSCGLILTCGTCSSSAGSRSAGLSCTRCPGSRRRQAAAAGLHLPVQGPTERSQEQRLV
jgi:hypothetical protein